MLAEHVIKTQNITLSHDNQFFVLSPAVSVPTCLAATGCIEKRRAFGTGLLKLVLETFNHVDESTSACLCFSRLQQTHGKSHDVYQTYYNTMYKGHTEVHYLFTEAIQLGSANLAAFVTQVYAFLLSHLSTYMDIDKFTRAITNPISFDGDSMFGHSVLIAVQECDLRPRLLARRTKLPPTTIEA